MVNYTATKNRVKPSPNITHAALVREHFDLVAGPNGGALGCANGGTPAYVYARCSTEGQARLDKDSFYRQFARISELAARQGYTIPFERVFFDIETGFEIEIRDSLNDLLFEIALPDRHASDIFLEHIDRLSREGDWQQGWLLYKIEQAGATPQFVDPPGTALERKVRGAIQQEVMEQEKKRLREGRLNAMRKGRPMVKAPAYGYHWQDDRHRAYAVYEPEAAIVRDIYASVASGESIRRVGEWLAARGVKPPGKHQHWERSIVRSIVTSETYKGDLIQNRTKAIFERREYTDEQGRTRFRKVECGRTTRPENEWIHVTVPAVVDPDLWDRAAKVLAQNKRMSPRNGGGKYLLTGLVKCATCGRTYQAHTARQHRKMADSTTKVYEAVEYRCTSRNMPKAKRAEVGCTQGTLRGHELESAVWAVVRDVLTRPELLLAAIAHKQDKLNEKSANDVAYHEGMLADIAAREERAIAGYMAGGFTAEEFAAKRKELAAERMTHQKQIDLRKQDNNLAGKYAKFEKMLRERKPIQDEPGQEVKRKLIKLLIDEIVLDTTVGTIEVFGDLRELLADPIVHIHHEGDSRG